MLEKPGVVAIESGDRQVPQRNQAKIRDQPAVHHPRVSKTVRGEKPGDATANHASNNSPTVAPVRG